MRRSTCYALLLCLFLATIPLYANITIDGDFVHVETDRLCIVEFKKGVIDPYPQQADRRDLYPPHTSRKKWVPLNWSWIINHGKH